MRQRNYYYLLFANEGDKIEEVTHSFKAITVSRVPCTALGIWDIKMHNRNFLH